MNRTARRTIIAAAAALACALLGAAPALATSVTLGFDDQSSGTTITTQYESADQVEFGVFTGGGSAGLPFVADAMSPTSVAQSAPNALEFGYCDHAEISQCDNDGYIHFDIPQSSIGFYLGFAGSAASSHAVSVTGYNASGAAVASLSPTVSYGVHTLVTLSSATANISFVEVSYTEFADGNHQLAIDDLTFQNGAPTPQVGVQPSGEVWLNTSRSAAASAQEGIKVGRFGGSTGPVTLAVSGLPSGVTGKFSANPFTGGNGATDTLTLSAPAGTPGRALTNVTLTATPSSTATGGQPVTTTFPLHVLNTYSLVSVGMSLTQTDPNGNAPNPPYDPKPDTGVLGGALLGSTGYSHAALVAGQGTTAHVFLDPTGLITAGASGITVKLYAYKAGANGAQLPGGPVTASPASPPALADQTIAKAAANSSDTSFDFTLPSAWTKAGTIDLVAQATAPGSLFNITPDPDPGAVASCPSCATSGPRSFKLNNISFAAGATRTPANQCTQQESFPSSTHFTSVVCDVPQLNQMRTTCAKNTANPLAANCLPFPNEWCVPTATMDLFAAYADRGALSSPAKKNWSTPANYNEMTRDLYRLGSLMGTGSGGSTGGGAQSGADSWLSSYQTHGGDLVYQQSGPPGISVGTNPTSGAEQMLRNLADNQQAGGLNTLGAGFYENAIQSPGQNPQSKFAPPSDPTNTGPLNPLASFRYGGHAIAMTGVSVSGSSATGQVHDPAQPFEGLTAQTKYETDSYHLRFVQLQGWGPDSGNPWKKGKNQGNGQGQTNGAVATVQLQGYWVPGVINPDINEGTIVDGYSEITPTSVVFPETSSSIALISDPAGSYHKHVFHAPGGVAHVAIDPLDPDRLYYSSPGSDRIHVLDVRGAHVTTLASAGAPILQLVPGGAQDGVFARTASTIVDVGPTGHMLGKIHGEFSTITVDGSDENLLAASPAHKSLKVYAPTLHLLGSSTLPASVIAGAGQMTLGVDPATQQVLFDSPSGSLFRGRLAGALLPAVARDAAATRRLKLKPFALRSSAQIVAENGAGELFGVAGGRLVTYDTAGKRTANQFGNVEVHGEVAVTQQFDDVPPDHLVDTPLPFIR